MTAWCWRVGPDIEPCATTGTVVVGTVAIVLRTAAATSIATSTGVGIGACSGGVVVQGRRAGGAVGSAVVGSAVIGAVVAAGVRVSHWRVRNA